ncbi:MAG: hypothetical protein RLZZ164_42 [Actinomycetota bacterium]
MQLSVGAQVAALFNSDIRDSKFVVISNYKISPSYLNDRSLLNYSRTTEMLSREFGVPFRHLSGSIIQAAFQIPRGENLESLRAQLFDVLVKRLDREGKSPAIDAEIAFGIWGLRGSWDGSSLYAVDIKKDEIGQIHRWQELVKRYSNIPYRDPNLRPPTSDKEHQVRVDVDWLIARVGPTIHRVNDYKYRILMMR